MGSYYGWIVLVHEEIVLLHNPVTGGSIELPCLDAPPSVLGAVQPKRESSGPLSDKHYVRKVILSCNPAEDGCIVVAWLISTTNWELAFCRKGDTHWTGLKMREKGRPLRDITYSNNSVYVVNSRREFVAYDLATLAMSIFPSKVKYMGSNGRLKLVEGDAKSDVPLIVITTKYHGNLQQIYVYKWINNHRHWPWYRVKNIGRSVLFLNHDNCFQLQLEELCGNVIYYEVKHSLAGGSVHVGINRMHIQTGDIVPHSPSPTEAFPQISGLPFWFTPSLR
jgi:hypothetical protein